MNDGEVYKLRINYYRFFTFELGLNGFIEIINGKRGKCGEII